MFNTQYRTRIENIFNNYLIRHQVIHNVTLEELTDLENKYLDVRKEILKRNFLIRFFCKRLIFSWDKIISNSKKLIKFSKINAPINNDVLPNIYSNK